MGYHEKQARILLLDDQSQEYENWREWLNLSDWNPELFYSQNIEDAIAVLNNVSPDIYLIDIFLEGENGLDFLELIKNKRGIKIVLTNSFEERDCKKAAEHGATCLINKKQSLKENLEVVDTVKKLWNSVKLPESDFLLNASGIQAQSNLTKHQGEQIARLENAVNLLSYKVEDLIGEYGELCTLIQGSGSVVGLRERVNYLENAKGETNFYTLLVEVPKIINKNPIVAIALSVALFIGVLSVPMYILHKLFSD